MTSGEGYGFRKRTEHRLKNHARGLGISPQRLQKELVFERLMARLLTRGRDRWALKGGLALDFRLGAAARTTKDMDLAWHSDADRLAEDILAVQAIDLGDHFTFSVQSSSDAHPDGQLSIRYRIRVDFGALHYADVIVDVGVGDEILGEPDLMPTPDYLRLPGVESIAIPVIPLEQHVAEKVHAYSREYASGPSSRVKDLIDLALIAGHETLHADRLHQALQTTFERRTRHPLPASLPTPPDIWAAPYRARAAEIGLDENVAAGFDLAARLVNPILEQTILSTAAWNPHSAGWGTDVSSRLRS